jgi:hypothetical protein
VGDLRVTVGRRLAGGGVRLFRLAAEVAVKVPTADEDRRLGTGEWDARAGVAAEYRFWSATAFGGAGWNRLGDPGSIELDDVWDAYAGVERATFGDRAMLAGWVDGRQEIVAGAGAGLAAGLELRGRGPAGWRLAVTAGLVDGSEDFGIVVGRSIGSGAGERRTRRVRP